MNALAYLAVASIAATWLLSEWLDRRDRRAYTAALAALDPAARQALWDEHCAGVPGLEDGPDLDALRRQAEAKHARDNEFVRDAMREIEELTGGTR